MLKRYGEKALEESAARADELALAGDDHGATTWRRIMAAVTELANKIPLARYAAAGLARREAAERSAHRLLMEADLARETGHASNRDLARALNERGIPTPRGGDACTHTTVARLLDRTAIRAGLLNSLHTTLLAAGAINSGRKVYH